MDAGTLSLTAHCNRLLGGIAAAVTIIGGPQLKCTSNSSRGTSEQPSRREEQYRKHQRQIWLSTPKRLGE
jgi:hypothetical protein